jgi:hypothetical protein
MAPSPNAGSRRQLASECAEEVKSLLGRSWLPKIYADEILSSRTRSYHLELPAGKRVVTIDHTLLGVELKIGARRSLCPDLSTARYLAVFARAGCADIAVPYDITRISGLADALESSWQRMLLLIEHLADGRTTSFRGRVRGILVDEIVLVVKEAGAGTPIPKFKETTRQRRI